jgi:hypothetical protein
MSIQAGELIRQQIVPGNPAPDAEVFRVRTRMDRAHRHHETHAVGRGHLAAAPQVGERQATLGAHQGGIGSRQRLVALIVLVDPGQAVALEGRDIAAGQRLQPGVAGLGHQYRAQVHLQIGRPGRALGQMRESLGEAGPPGDLQQQLRQFHAG